jgi:hypothetical protein
LNSGENINSSIATVATTLQGLLARPSNTNPNDSTASVRLVEIPCEGNSSKNGYACTTQFSISEVAKLSGISIADINSYISNNDYYLRLQTIYNNTHFSISAKDKDDNLIYFDKVQASVDVTGRASDSLKRLSARLDPSNGNDDYLWWPDYAVDSAGRVCKDMTIQAWDGTENCKDTD